MKRTLRFAVVLAFTVPVIAQNGPLATRYKPAADKLIPASLADPEGYANLQYLCDHIGKRVSGSESLLKAIAWATDLMKQEGFSNVHTQAATVPHWVRGEESGEIVAPVTKKLHLLGLGMSVATPPEGITAEVVVVPDFTALNQLGKAGVAGKIVVFNAPYKGYGQTVQYRTAGPSQAAALGAVGVLVRSITPLAVQLPHTGTTSYDESLPKIPAAAISLEDAMMLERLQKEYRGQHMKEELRGNKGQPHTPEPVKVHFSMQAHLEAPQVAANIMGDIVGTEHPEQIVVVGGHIDSWDVGQGAQDDGSGIMATLAAVHEIMKSGLKPKRTIRICFWVNEENGGAGGKAYRAALSDAELKNHVAAIEMDGGAEPPIGYGYGAAPGGGRRRAAPGDPATPPPAPGLSREEEHSLALLRDIGTLLAPVLTSSPDGQAVRPGGGGSDISPLMADGVPGLGETTTGAHYFDWHHTEADTLDKVDPQDFRKNVASLAVMVYILADMPEILTGHKGAGE